MSVAEHYIRLRTHYADVKEGETVEVTRDELAVLLCCTVRHVPLVLKKLAERKWIDWRPGNGRGHMSRLTLRISRDQLLLSQAQELVESGRVTEAMELVSSQVVNVDLQDRFFRTLQNHFGVRSEIREEKRVDTLRLPFGRPLPNLDPAHVYRRTEAHMSQQVMETLVRFDVAAQRIVPHLAHHWESEDEGRSWTFYLRKGVLFHHGREMTALDVKLTFERLINPDTGTGHGAIFSDIQHITVISDTAVRFEFHNPNYLFIHYLCLHCASIVPMEKVWEPNFTHLPTGTGPWKIIRNDDTMLVFEAFSRYFFGRPHLDRVEVLIVPDRERSQTLGQLAGKEVVYYPFQPKPEAQDQWLHLQRIESGVNFLAFNLRREGPLRDPLLREALDAGIDRARMVRELGGGKVEAFGFVRGEEETTGRDIDIERAKKLVAGSSYLGEVLRIFVYSGGSNECNAAWLRDRMAEIGVNTEVVVVSPEDINKAGVQAQADMINAGYVYDDDLELAVSEILVNGSSYILNLLGSEHKDYVVKRIQELKREPGSANRWEILREIEERLKAERALLFLYHAGQSIVYHPSLQGVQLNVRGWVDYKELWVKG